MCSIKKCIFCCRKGLLEEIPRKSDNNKTVPCKRGIYEDDYCFAVLAPEQYSIGHTLLILEKHRKDITDNISKEESSAFINALHEISKHLKEKAKNEFNQSSERIYACILCDGIEHLHAHLIPRYPFTAADGNIYEQLFLERDGRKNINIKIEKDDLGGFWYIAEREKNYKKSVFGQKSDEERAKYIEELAEKLRMSRI